MIRDSSLGRWIGSRPEDGLRGMGIGLGELPVLHKLSNVAGERCANCCEFGKMDASGARLDPVIGKA